MTKFDEIRAFLLNRGYDLKNLKGYSNDSNTISKALNKQETLEALDLYYRLKIPILGGDVFYLNKKKEFGWTLDNWYFIKKEEESDMAFLERSIGESKAYIKKYNNILFEDCIFLFDIVYESSNLI